VKTERVRVSLASFGIYLMFFGLPYTVLSINFLENSGHKMLGILCRNNALGLEDGSV
jgi:hypothetical protein